MGKLKIDRESAITKVDEAWFAADFDGNRVNVHVMVHRSDAGPNKGKFHAGSHLHKPTGGGMMVSSGGPKTEGWLWFATREEAIESSLQKMEAKEDHKIKFPTT